jgi:hypothetical protein
LPQTGPFLCGAQTILASFDAAQVEPALESKQVAAQLISAQLI